MANISVAPFSPTYHCIQELSCNYKKVVIPDGFADLVASRITEPDIVDQIIANLNVLNPDSLQQTATALLTQDISSMLVKLSHKITQAPTTGDTSLAVLHLIIQDLRILCILTRFALCHTLVLQWMLMRFPQGARLFSRTVWHLGAICS